MPSASRSRVAPWLLVAGVAVLGWHVRRQNPGGGAPRPLPTVVPKRRRRRLSITVVALLALTAAAGAMAADADNQVTNASPLAVATGVALADGAVVDSVGRTVDVVARNAELIAYVAFNARVIEYVAKTVPRFPSDEWWYRLGRCEQPDGNGGVRWDAHGPNPESGNVYVGGLGIMEGLWNQMNVYGFPPGWRASPDQQMTIARDIFARYGASAWGCSRTAGRPF